MKTREKGILNNSDIYFLTPSKQAQNTFFYVTCVGHFFYEDTYRIRRENYHSYLLMYLKNGNAVIEANGKSYQAQKGDLVYMNCYEPHGYRAAKQLETIWFHFDGIGAAAYFKALSETESPVFHLADDTRTLHYMKKIYENYKERPNFRFQASEAVVSSYVTAVLAELFQNTLGETRDMDRYADVAEETKQYVEEHLPETLDIATLASNVSLSEYYFARVFKRESGYTPHEYVVKTRINRAKILLKSTGLPQREIAVQCGFLNESRFITAFKRSAGMTPGEFRRLKI